MAKLSTRSIETAQAIADRKPFTTHGSLNGTTWPDSSGRLNAEETKKYYEDRNDIDYVVYSYATPIAWHTSRGWHKVNQKFSVTTTKHQGNLYLI